MRLLGTILIFTALGSLRQLTADTLSAHVSVDTSTAGVWSYTVFNDEPTGSPNYVTAFNLNVDAPVTVTGIPAGWDVDTNNTTFVFWFNTDAVLPYPHDIAPGSSLGGFMISSPGSVSDVITATAVSWDHSLDQPGPTSDLLSVLGPASVPEPSSSLLFVAGTLMWLIRRRSSL